MAGILTSIKQSMSVLIQACCDTHVNGIDPIIMYTESLIFDNNKMATKKN